jgi:hypothetical protein
MFEYCEDWPESKAIQRRVDLRDLDQPQIA